MTDIIKTVLMLEARQIKIEILGPPCSYCLSFKKSFTYLTDPQCILHQNTRNKADNLHFKVDVKITSYIYIYIYIALYNI